MQPYRGRNLAEEPRISTVLASSEVQLARSLLLFILSCSGTFASNLFKMSEENQVMYKLLRRGANVDLSGGRVFKRDPEVVLVWSGV